MNTDRQWPYGSLPHTMDQAAEILEDREAFSMSEDLVIAMTVAVQLIDAAKAVGCVCEVRSGNPMVSSHSEQCAALQDAVAYAEGSKP